MRTATGPQDPGPEDGAWIRAALARHERALVAYARRLLGGDLGRAQDCVQEVFLRLCRTGPEAVDGRLTEWLFTVCRNQAVDLRRKETRMSTLSDDQAAAAPAGGPRPGEALEREDALAHVLTLLGTLPENQQEALRLKFQHGLSYREIANVTQEPIGTVGWLIHAGIQRLRARLTADAPEGAQA